MLKKEEAMVLADMQAYIAFAIVNYRKVSFGNVLTTLGHDISALLSYDSLEAAKRDCFLPRTSGYCAFKVRRAEK